MEPARGTVTRHLLDEFVVAGRVLERIQTSARTISGSTDVDEVKVARIQLLAASLRSRLMAVYEKNLWEDES